jgi:hypothetical protein
VKKPQCLEKRGARLGVKNIYGFEFLVEIIEDYGDRCDGFLFAKGRERAGGKDFSVLLTCLCSCLCQQSTIRVFALGDTGCSLWCSSFVASA